MLYVYVNFSENKILNICNTWILMCIFFQSVEDNKVDCETHEFHLIWSTKLHSLNLSNLFPNLDCLASSAGMEKNE